MDARYTSFSSCGSWALEHGLSGCGTRAYLLRGMWDLRGPGILLMSPSLQGGFLTNGTPGKPSYFLKLFECIEQMLSNCYLCFWCKTFSDV